MQGEEMQGLLNKIFLDLLILLELCSLDLYVTLYLFLTGEFLFVQSFTSMNPFSAFFRIHVLD